LTPKGARNRLLRAVRDEPRRARPRRQLSGGGPQRGARLGRGRETVASRTVSAARSSAARPSAQIAKTSGF